MDNRKTIIIISTIIFIIGLVIGYAIWGKKETKEIDVKQLLTRAIEEIKVIEKENQDLRAKLQDVKSETLTQENQNLKEQLEKALQDNKKLEDELSNLKMQLTQTEKKLKSEESKPSIENLKSRIAQLEKENQGLKFILGKINSLTTQRETEISKQLKEKINLKESQEKIIKKEAHIEEKGNIEK